MELGVVDSIHLGGTGGHFQSLTLQFPQATCLRTVSLTVTGWRGENRQHSRSFVVEGLAVDASDSVRAQLTDGGSELILDNLGSAKTFTLRLVAGVEALTVAERLNVPKSYAYELVRQQKLDAIRLGKYVRVAQETLAKYIATAAS